ncbi:MAG: putative two-component system response regulator [Thermoleophilia bacterium]|nr:putative two-component system response regulator [Thermoleophilia bacterium]MCZ4495529.1 putative two-component system response regulator [Thermoleophilia bacterium]
MTERQKQIGRNESDARTANELVSVDGEQAKLAGHETLAVLCECGDNDCHEPLTMSVDEYEVIRSEPAQFAVIAGHEILDCERVITTHPGYLIVEKFGDAGTVADAADPRHNLKTCRVVVVDDIPEIRYLLRIVLAVDPSSTVVGEASNGAEAIEVVDAMQPEVIVLDLEMPVMDGWHALPHLRRVAPTAHIIVFSSTEVDARLEKRLANLGADRFVRKGGDPSIIVNAVREVATSGRDRQFAGDGDGGGRHVDAADDDNPGRRSGESVS